MTLTPDQVASTSAPYWAAKRWKIKLQKGTFSFEGRQYLLEPMQCAQKNVRRRCFMKGTQGGFTEEETNEELHGLIHGRYPRGVLVLFPSKDEVSEFSKARFGPLISANPTAIGQYVKDTDTATTEIYTRSIVGSVRCV